MKNNRVQKITRIAVLSAIAYLLQMLGSFMGLKVAGFLEIEFSDFPALIGAFAIGPLAGVLVELIKNLLHCFTTSTGFVGEFANFMVNGVFVLTAGLIYKYNRTRRGAMVSMLIAVLAMTLSAMATNLFVMLPLYMKDAPFNVKLNLVLTTITPFNFIRGTVLSLITFFSYKKLKPLLADKRK